MALTHDDVKAIGEAVRPIVKEEIGQAIENIVRPLVKAEMQAAFTQQNSFIGKHFEDMKLLMEQSYVKREEFEALQNEVDDLRKEIKRLKQGLHTPS
jgi:hypothetical protein